MLSSKDQELSSNCFMRSYMLVFVLSGVATLSTARGDTQQYSDMNKLARRFLLGSQMSVNGDSCSAPSKAYVEEVVKEIRNGERGECPICLESVDDAVLTPCAHHMCRECLLASWRSSLGGSCPVCR
jgi:DNA repair protein RAD5